jgi:cell division protein FtsN
MNRDLKPRPSAVSTRSGSRGNTLVGIFVGLIIGALVAAGVAMYFTSNSPFKKPKADEQNPAVTPPATKPIQPAPTPAPAAQTPAKPAEGGGAEQPIALPGKPGDKPVEKPRYDFYNALPKGPDSLPAPADRPTETEVVKPTDKKPKAETPEQAAERAKAEAALLDKPQPQEKFYLQAGAFENPAEADNLRAKLALMGVEAGVQKIESPEKGTLHRVRVGPFTNPDELNKARQQLQAGGVTTALIRIKPREPKPASPAQ